MESEYSHHSIVAEREELPPQVVEESSELPIEDYLENSVYRDVIGSRPKPREIT